MKTIKGVLELVTLSLFLFPLVSEAKVTGQCGNCHTMHNSQGGEPVAQKLAGEAMTTTSTPNEALLITNCIGCHQGNNSIGGFKTPYVLQIDRPQYGETGTENNSNTLAGGNFYWVSRGEDAKGHNVDGISKMDSRFGNIPPGGHELLTRLTCAGTTGCHGDRTKNGETYSMRGSHHGNSTAKWKDGSTLVKSYRFLSAVQGMEDPEYEYRPDRKHHNKYYGIDRIAETQDDDSTISSLCAQCHTDYHQGNGKISTETFGRSAWLRHPTDFDMGNIKGAKSEYADYNPDGMDKNAYSVIAPVATSNTTEQLNERVYVTPRDAIVMCLSCHRAHGTPHDAILRWDYKAWPGPGGYNGCAICHTTKD